MSAVLGVCYRIYADETWHIWEISWIDSVHRYLDMIEIFEICLFYHFPLFFPCFRVHFAYKLKNYCFWGGFQLRVTWRIMCFVWYNIIIWYNVWSCDNFSSFNPVNIWILCLLFMQVFIIWWHVSFILFFYLWW